MNIHVHVSSCTLINQSGRYATGAACLQKKLYIIQRVHFCFVLQVDLCIEPGQSLGLMIRGGIEYNLGIFITGVDKDSVADRAGLMVSMINKIILRWCGIIGIHFYSIRSYAKLFVIFYWWLYIRLSVWRCEIDSYSNRLKIISDMQYRIYFVKWTNTKIISIDVASVEKI